MATSSSGSRSASSRTASRSGVVEKVYTGVNTADLRYEHAPAALSAPLGDRAVIDAATGRRKVQSRPEPGRAAVSRPGGADATRTGDRGSAAARPARRCRNRPAPARQRQPVHERGAALAERGRDVRQRRQGRDLPAPAHRRLQRLHDSRHLSGDADDRLPLRPQHRDARGRDQAPQPPPEADPHRDGPVHLRRHPAPRGDDRKRCVGRRRVLRRIRRRRLPVRGRGIRRPHRTGDPACPDATHRRDRLFRRPLWAAGRRPRGRRPLRVP